MTITFINDTWENSAQSIKDESVDLFFCDPPYYISGNKKNIDLKTGDRTDWDAQWKTKEEYYDWLDTWIRVAFKQLKNTGSIYICISWQHSGKIQEILEKNSFIVRNRITWKRDKGRGSDTNWKSMHEDIWFVTKSNNYVFNIDDVKQKKKVLAPYVDEEGNPKDWYVDENGEKVRLTHPGNLWDELTVPFWSMMEVKSYAKTKKTPDNTLAKHNTQKPKDLVKKCILASSNENDLVVDYFFGSGTTGITAKELNRNFIGFDINKTCYDMALTRFNKE